MVRKMVKKSASYKNKEILITGGLGALGKIFAQYLINNYQARVILLGRSPLNEMMKRVIDEVSQNSSNVKYLQADVTNREDMVRVYRSIKADCDVLNGIQQAVSRVIIIVGYIAEGVYGLLEEISALVFEVIPIDGV